MVVALTGQAQHLHKGIVFDQVAGQVFLVPAGKDQKDLRPRLKTGFHVIVPAGDQLLAHGRAVCLLAVSDGVVDDHQMRRVSGDTGLYAAGSHGSASVLQFKVRFLAAVFCDADAKKGFAVLFHLAAVHQAEPLCKGIVVADFDHASVRISAQIPGRQRFGQVHALAVLGRLRDDQNVIRVARVGFQKALHSGTHQLGCPVWNVHSGVDVLDIAVIVLGGPAAQNLPFGPFQQLFFVYFPSPLNTTMTQRGQNRLLWVSILQVCQRQTPSHRLKTLVGKIV